MNKIRVSVIIPTYNCGKYIAEAIDSVLAQTRHPDEIFIVDDGSTDDTQAIVSAYSDSKIRYVRMPHKGTSAARSRGIDLASGDYLAFLDADDLWRPAMLEKQLAVMEGDETLVCSFTNFVRFQDGAGEPFTDQFIYYPEIKGLPVTRHADGCTFTVQGDAFVHFVRFGEIPAYMQCMLFRRAMLGEMRLNESLRKCQDLEFVLRVFMRGKVAFTRQVLADVRRHDSNATKDISLMAIDKLSALLPLQHAVDSALRRAALNDRLVKAWIDAATALISEGKRLDGIRYFSKIFALPAFGLRKQKGTARIAYELVRSLGRRRSAVTRGAAESPNPADVAWRTNRRH